MFDRYLIEHCAPTLASLKSASLFCLTKPDVKKLKRQIESWNRDFIQKGIFLTVLKNKNDRALIYVCRKSHLLSDLNKPGVSNFLKKYGYNVKDIKSTLLRLRERVNSSETFPHEIGVFLGYPLEDVIGFIKNSGQNSICTGCWKVYYNECEALKLFKRYKKCREVYQRLFKQGKTVLQLTVAA